jgi:hypothetical protein
MAPGKKWYSLFVVTDDPAAGTAAPSQSQTVDEMFPDAGSSPAAVPAPAAGGAADFDAVYQAAQIAPPAHGYTVLKVADMLRSEHLKALPADVKQKSIMVALDAAGVKVAEIVQDAVRRDRALDTYERVLQKHADEARAAADAENKQLEAEIAQRVAEMRARIDENNRKASAEHDEFVAWRTRKQQEEAAIAEAVSYFVSDNPITISRATTTHAQGDPDVR